MSFRKTFLSIKGIYYQVEIMGQKITWIIPYKFAQTLPHDIDYSVMNTFLEFYESLLKFVNFKLYSDVGLTYPPERMDLNSVDETKIDLPTVLGLQDTVMKNLHGNEDDHVISEEFRQTEEYKVFQKENSRKNLFQGKVFYFNREVPTYALEFIVPAFGGKFGYEGEASQFGEDSAEITHHVMDRPLTSDKSGSKTKDFVVPQYVFDCINSGLLLPVNQYAPGQPSPPHLSPFVDNKAEGYLPDRQQEINELKGITEEVYMPEVDDGKDSSDEEKPEAEAKGDKFDDESSGDEDDNEMNEKEKVQKAKIKKSLEKERKELGKLMMSKKQRRQYTRINYNLRKKRDEAGKLMSKKKQLKSDQ